MSNHKKLKKKDGGKVNVYNAQGSPTMEEAKNKKPGFKKGGTTKLKTGGKVPHAKSHKRLDKKGRKMAAGGSPYSAAHKMSKYQDGGAGEGHQNDGPRGEDREGE